MVEEREMLPKSPSARRVLRRKSVLNSPAMRQVANEFADDSDIFVSAISTSVEKMTPNRRPSIRFPAVSEDVIGMEASLIEEEMPKAENSLNDADEMKLHAMPLAEDPSTKMQVTPLASNEKIRTPSVPHTIQVTPFRERLASSNSPSSTQSTSPKQNSSPPCQPAKPSPKHIIDLADAIDRLVKPSSCQDQRFSYLLILVEEALNLR